MKYCANCGHEVSDEMTYCPYCGANFNQQGYNPYNAYGTVPQDGKDYGTPALICGVLGFFVAGLILGIIAVVLANKEKARCGGYLTGNAKAGKICGIINIILGSIALVFSVVLGIVYAILLSEGTDPIVYQQAVAFILPMFATLM